VQEVGDRHAANKYHTIGTVYRARRGSSTSAARRVPALGRRPRIAKIAVPTGDSGSRRACVVRAGVRPEFVVVNLSRHFCTPSASRGAARRVPASPCSACLCMPWGAATGTVQPDVEVQQQARLQGKGRNDGSQL